MKRAHSTFIFAVSLAALVCARPAPLRAQQATGEAGIMLDLQDAPLREVLRMLAVQAQCDITIGPEVQGNVDATLHNLTVDQALDSLLEPHGYHWWRNDRGAYVISKSPRTSTSPPPPAVTGDPTRPLIQEPSLPAPRVDLTPGRADDTLLPMTEGSSTGGRAQQARPLPPRRSDFWIPSDTSASEPQQMVYDVVPLKYIDARDFVALFTSTEPSPSRVLSSTPLGSLVGSYFQSPTDQLVRLMGAGRTNAGQPLGGLGAPNQQFPGGGGFDNGGGFGGGFDGGLGGIGGIGGNGIGGGGIGGGGGQLFEPPPGIEAIGAYNPLNAVLIRGEDNAVAELKDLINKIDVPIRQIEISAQFVEVRTEDQNNMGLEWRVAGASTSFVVQGLISGGTASMRYAKGNFLANLGVLLNNSRAKIISSPKVTTQNNLPATLQIVDQFPYFAQFIVFDQFGNPVTTSVPITVPVSTFLTVVPRVNYDGSVTAFITPAISDIVGFAIGPNGEEIPRVVTRTIQSLLTVKDGETIALAGFVRKTSSDGGNKVPVLSELPIIGGLFKAKRLSHQDSEVIIFMTPRVLWTEETLPGAPGYGGATG